MIVQARSEPFDVQGPSLRCSLVPLDLVLPDDSFLVPTELTEMCPPRILVGYASSYNHSNKDWVGVARVGGEPNTGETSGYVVACAFCIGKTVFGDLNCGAQLLAACATGPAWHCVV
jgi:hypothetical protein